MQKALPKLFRVALTNIHFLLMGLIVTLHIIFAALLKEGKMKFPLLLIVLPQPLLVVIIWLYQPSMRQPVVINGLIKPIGALMKILVLGMELLWIMMGML